MALIRNRALSDDSFRLLEPGEVLPPEGDVFATLEQLESAREGGALPRRGRTGLHVLGDVDLEQIAGVLQLVDAVALEIPRYTDGRVYSTARLLRDRLGFRGELRATGHVLRDQLAYLERCGIDAFELAEGQNPAEALKAFGEISVHYQPAAQYPGSPNA